METHLIEISLKKYIAAEKIKAFFAHYFSIDKIFSNENDFWDASQDSSAYLHFDYQEEGFFTNIEGTMLCREISCKDKFLFAIKLVEVFNTEVVTADITLNIPTPVFMIIYPGGFYKQAEQIDEVDYIDFKVYTNSKPLEEILSNI